MAKKPTKAALAQEKRRAELLIEVANRKDQPASLARLAEKLEASGELVLTEAGAIATASMAGLDGRSTLGRGAAMLAWAAAARRMAMGIDSVAPAAVPAEDADPA